jgi:hypothetical protein
MNTIMRNFLVNQEENLMSNISGYTLTPSLRKYFSSVFTPWKLAIDTGEYFHVTLSALISFRPQFYLILNYFIQQNESILLTNKVTFILTRDIAKESLKPEDD